MFRRHRWPGNVRELKNAVHRLALTPERLITGISRIGALGAPSSELAPNGPLLPLSEARRENTDAFERAYVVRALELGGQNVPRAADIAGISRQMMLRLANKHGLR
jgi:DNA-binding NtrC family response regulator